MIGILNYGSGNIQAICNIYDKLNTACTIISHPDELSAVDKIILPGVGAFDETMTMLNNSGLREALDKQVLILKKPVLGICVGMQIMSERSEEGILSGLGWIRGQVKLFDTSQIPNKPKVPHLGWNSITPKKIAPLLQNLDNEAGFYFIHSYYFKCEDETDILTETFYGTTFASSINKENVYGVQFHPEKSHSNGVNLLRNFSIL